MSQQILNLDELSTLEHRYAGILGAGELMRRAGDAVARVIESRIAKPAHVVIVCGPGNNGGDGYAAALALQAKGYRVTCTVTDASGVAKVKMPTWTLKDGQDDLVWHDRHRGCPQNR